MFFVNFYHINPPIDIHGWKATDLSVVLAPSDRNLKHPTSRQNFRDAPGQTPKLILTLCRMTLPKIWTKPNRKLFRIPKFYNTKSKCFLYQMFRQNVSLKSSCQFTCCLWLLTIVHNKSRRRKRAERVNQAQWSAFLQHLCCCAVVLLCSCVTMHLCHCANVFMCSCVIV